MTSYLIDINVWLALSWRLHPQATPAARWFQSLPKSETRLLFCRITQLGLLRLVTNEKVMGESVLNVGQALDVFDRWNEDPRVEFAPEPRGVESAFRRAALTFAGKPATKVLMDAYLAGFAESERATLVTFDKGLTKIAGRGKISCLLLSSH